MSKNYAQHLCIQPLQSEVQSCVRIREVNTYTEGEMLHFPHKETGSTLIKSTHDSHIIFRNREISIDISDTQVSWFITIFL